jgi:2-polyprenyl-3-methyl-5-hydroxy-6-metoxy-1,4-benzoquinol methylase
MPTSEQLLAHNEESYRAGRYAEFASAMPVRVAIARDRLQRLRPLAPDGPWLDVGASTGSFVEQALQAGLDAEGIELSHEAVARARARDLPVREGSVESWKPERRFAVVTMLDVVEHIPAPAELLRRVRPWLQPEGLLALTLPDCSAPMARLLGRHWFYYLVPDHVHQFTPRTIRRLLEVAGFRDVQVRRVAKPMPLAYAAHHTETMAPVLAPFARAFVRMLPAKWSAVNLPLPLGEMLVTGRPAIAAGEGAR